jgi:hypothetical protein
MLQRRVAAGEADLEHIGLSRIKVPREVLERLPVYPYPDLSSTPTASAPSDNDSPPETGEKAEGEEAEREEPEGGKTEGEKTEGEQPEGEQSDGNQPSQPSPEPNDSSQQPAEENEPTPSSSSPKIPEQPAASKSDSNEHTPVPAPTPAATPPDNNAAHRLSHAQTTCAICLDDFIPHTSTVRELPCGHIFHSSCIDIFLTQNSCLCPLCKKSVLPSDQYRAPTPRRTSRPETAGRSRENQP